MAQKTIIGLAGNPNCGKTTLFNELTGSNGYVGNWPGVTVEKKQANWRADKDVTFVDLPGIYSLSPYSPEEQVSRDYLINERPDAIIDAFSSVSSLSSKPSYGAFGSRTFGFRLNALQISSVWAKAKSISSVQPVCPVIIFKLRFLFLSISSNFLSDFICKFLSSARVFKNA